MDFFGIVLLGADSQFAGTVLLGIESQYAGSSGYVAGMLVAGTQISAEILVGELEILWSPECPYWTGLQGPLVCSYPSFSLYSCSEVYPF